MKREEVLRHQIVNLLPRLRRFARRLAKNPDMADDLVQGACERALRRLDQVSVETRLDSWLYRIIYTQWIDDLRRRRALSARLVVLADQHNSDNAGVNPDAESPSVLDIRKALKIIPEDQLAAIMLVCVEGYSYEETASVLNVPVGTVASRVARARTILGKTLSLEKHQVLQDSNRERKEGSK